MELKEKLKTLPDKPGVYIMKDAFDEIIYVGKAVSLKNRVRSYFQKHGQLESSKTKVMVSRITDVEWIITDTELEALILESNLIKKYRPPYNVRLRDDKHYPYICITLRDPFPRAIVTRRVKKDGNRYFGPYTSSHAVRQTLDVIKKVFKLRPCNRTVKPGERSRPCLDYHLGQCLGTCAGLISVEEYARVVKEVTLFLEGKQANLIRYLERQMQTASESLHFERAARIRDQIQSINLIIERQKVISTALTDQDIIALVSDNGNACAQLFFIRNGKLMGQEHFFLEGTSSEELSEATRQFITQYYEDAPYIPKEILLPSEIEEMEIIEQWLSRKRGSKVHVAAPSKGEKRKLVEMAVANAVEALKRLRQELELEKMQAEQALLELQQVLGMPEIPYRIEAFDISNTQGTEAVGSMVVFEGARPRKSDYRRFRIKYTEESPNDYAMMYEVLSRRLRRYDDPSGRFGSPPDLILIDGGKGQLGMALKAMTEIGVRVPAIGLAKQHEEIFIPGLEKPLILPPDSPALHLLQRVRDEAHRFAVTYHRSLRSKRAMTSILDQIEGIGDKRRQALLMHFGSVDAILKASPEQLAEVPGMNRRIAGLVFENLHS